MDKLFDDFSRAFVNHNGWELSQTLLPLSPRDDPNRLRNFWQGTNHYAVEQDIKDYMVSDVASAYKVSKKNAQNHLAGWIEVYVAYWKAVGEILAAEGDAAANGRTSSWTRVYEEWKKMAILIIRGYTNHGFEAWSVPVLYVVGKYLRMFAIKSDEERSKVDSTDGGMQLGDDFDPELEKQQQLRDCEQQLKRMFTLCLSDRAEIAESRKWGVYGIINLLFKTYFKLNSASLARTILKSLASNTADMPGLDKFPAPQRVTFKYYEGVLAFLEENYVVAEQHLTEAWSQCHRDARSNQERILTYLIPCRLLTSHTLPSAKLLDQYPGLRSRFQPLAHAIKRGDLRAFDLALQEGEDYFVKKRIYLTLERGRDIALRNLLRKVFLAKGFVEAQNPSDPPVRQTRVTIAEFAAAISLGSRKSIDEDEVECLLANMIYKNLMKGYIARERSTVVLSKTGAFPGTGI